MFSNQFSKLKLTKRVKGDYKKTLYPVLKM